MKLSDFGIMPQTAMIAFIGKPEATGKTSSEGEEYFAWKLKTPITVRCSTDANIEPLVEVEELYVRQSDLEKDVWVAVTEGKPDEGITAPGWKADFSKGQEIAIFQETTIAKWAKDNRAPRRDAQRVGINQRIADRQARRAGKI